MKTADQIRSKINAEAEALAQAETLVEEIEREVSKARKEGRNYVTVETCPCRAVSLARKMLEETDKYATYFDPFYEQIIVKFK